MSHVFGYAVGIDMTRRDLQDVAKKLARPWEVAKAFEGSAPCTALVPAPGRRSVEGRHLARRQRRAAADRRPRADDLGHPQPDRIPLDLFELKAGDLIFTGTPAGVGAIKKGDKMKGHVDGVGDLEVTVVLGLR